LIPYDPKARDRSFRMPSVLRRLRAERAGVAVLFPNSFRTALLAWLSGIPSRVGYVKSGRSLLLTDRLDWPRDRDGKRLPTPIVETYNDLAVRLGCPVDSVLPELFTTEADESAADRAFSRLGLSRSEPVVCLNTGGAFGPAKNWPVEHFAALARRLASEAGHAVLVVCGPSERSAARAIALGADHPRVVSLADESVSLGLTKACIRRAGLLITTDSGPRHFAAAFRVPVLTLFGPTFIAWTRTYHPRAFHVYHPVPCGPCQRPVCPLKHHQCMRDLLPDAVYRAALRLLPTSASLRG
jgi:heptosyltransferase-2